MSATWQRVKIKIPKAYGPAERAAIGSEIVNRIVERSRKENVDKNGNPFPKYTTGYTNSLDFKIAGKRKGKVNLTLSGDMLDALQMLSQKPGEITVGFKNGTPENAKADGNIKGTYGQATPIRGKKRDFLGLKRDELQNILQRFPRDEREKSKARAERIVKAQKLAKELL